MLIVNPHATSTTPLRRDVIARALASELDLTVVQTRYRGHAAHFAGEAARDGCEHLVLTLGGDGTVNEAVNGLLRASRPTVGGPETRPALAPCRAAARTSSRRALGMPVRSRWTPPAALLAALTGGGRRTIGVGLARGPVLHRSTPGWVSTPKWSVRSKGCARMGRRRAPGFMCGPRSAISTASPIGASPHSPWN